MIEPNDRQQPERNDNCDNDARGNDRARGWADHWKPLLGSMIGAAVGKIVGAEVDQAAGDLWDWLESFLS
ncbi:hypothetical protein [Nocardia sp. IFM 10818]